MLRKPIVRNLTSMMFVVIFHMNSVNVSVLILCVMELLQIKFCIFDYSREATILLVEIFQKQILSLQKHCRSS